MENKNLSYFMREELKTEEIVTVPGLNSIKDENGEVIPFKIKRLTREHIDDIYEHYKQEIVAIDKRTKKPYVVDNKVVMQEKRDYSRAFRHVMVEAFVYPNLKDEKLMEYYDCVDVTEMPRKVFSSSEFNEVVKKLNTVLGLTGPEDEDKETQDDLDNAKK